MIHGAQEARGGDYSLFGLRVRSAMPLPELTSASEPGPPDVAIGVGPVDVPAGATEGLHPSNGSLVLVIPEIASFRISGGDAIVVDARPGVPERNIRLFLLGSAFGALLHQRGLLPLHANAVEIDGRGVAFMGPSGAGKSTLAAWFHDCGHRVIADDVCVVRFDQQGRPMACPGLPRFRLWDDAVRFTGRDTDAFSRSYIGDDEQLEKFDIPIAPAGSTGSEIPLAAVYLLGAGRDFVIHELRGLDAAQAIFENTYRGSWVAMASAHHAHWRSAARLTQTTKVFRVERQWGLGRLSEEGSCLLAHARAALGG